jgi:hypothetical protein
MDFTSRLFPRTATVTKQGDPFLRAARYSTFAIVLTGILLISNPSRASSIADCRSQLGVLHEALPNGVTGVWEEIVLEESAKINAMRDKTSLAAGLDALETEYEAYLKDPDPDGDGFATAPEVMQARVRLSVCLYEARAAELAGPAKTSDEAGNAEPEEKAAAEEDHRSPPQPIRNPSSWFASAAYPVIALREARSGVVRFEVTVAADGSVAGCQASGPPNSADLELATCDAVIAHARFTPATDRAGRAVVGEFANAMRWALP